MVPNLAEILRPITMKKKITPESKVINTIVGRKMGGTKTKVDFVGWACKILVRNVCGNLTNLAIRRQY